tara:strand:+ start:3656 stop:4375 length:720 start_codon:yes stop_codon:yes gene_type:complete
MKKRYDQATNNIFKPACNTPVKHSIYLIRHGDVDVKPGTCYGQLDCDLSSSFDDDLLKLAEYFKFNLFAKTDGNEKVEAPFIISSPLIRCVKLAKGLKKYLDRSSQKQTKLQINDAFKEINFGQWEGESWQNIGQTQIQDWNNNLLDYTFPNGESARSFDLRIIDAWNVLQDQLAEQQTAQTVIIICHAGVIRSILCDFLQIPLQHSLSLNIDKMSLSCLNLVSTQAELSRCTGVNLSL